MKAGLAPGGSKTNQHIATLVLFESRLLSIKRYKLKVLKFYRRGYSVFFIEVTAYQCCNKNTGNQNKPVLHLPQLKAVFIIRSTFLNYLQGFFAPIYCGNFHFPLFGRTGQIFIGKEIVL